MTSGDELQELIRAARRVIESDFSQAELDAWRSKASHILAGLDQADSTAADNPAGRLIPGNYLKQGVPHD